MEKQPAVYMMSNRRGGVIYTGVTSDLIRRVYQHRTHAVAGFTQRYSLDRLVWYELHQGRVDAIEREKRNQALEQGLEGQADRNSKSWMVRLVLSSRGVATSEYRSLRRRRGTSR